MAVVATSAIVVSNYMYFYGGYSIFKKGTNHREGVAYMFGFRKTFKNSALEYGGSYTRADDYYENCKSWGAHLNYVHNIFQQKTPQWLKVYVGSSINYVSEFGYGGIAGANFRFADRFRFDVRYE